MGSDEERLEEMLKAVLEEENKKAAQHAQVDAGEEDLPEELPEIEEVPEEVPELPVEDMPEDLPEELPEIEEVPELPAEDIPEEVPELPVEDMPEELPEIEEVPEFPAEDIPEEVPEELPEMEEVPELPMDDFPEEIPEIPERGSEEKQDSTAKEMAVDPLEFLAMSEEEIDKVLEEEAALGEMFTGKMTEEKSSEKLSEKVSEKPEEQDALSDIQEMLQMSDDHVLVDEEGMGGPASFGPQELEQDYVQDFPTDVPDMGEDIGEAVESGKKKSPKKKKEKKVKEKKVKENGEEKESLGKRLAAAFFGSDDDELEDVPVKEDKKGKGKSADDGDGGEVKEKKKKKKEKKEPAKKEKEKNPAKAAKEKLQKEKKAEKAKLKAAKAEQAEKERRAAKKLPKKRVIVWSLLCASIGVGILLINSVGMATIQMTQARNAFDEKDFGTVYSLLNGKELSEEDQLIFGQSSAVLHLEHAEDAYENHLKMNKSVKALEDLLKGVEKYQGILSANGGALVTPELTAEYQWILETLQEQYGLSEAGAIEINGIESDYEYSLQLEALVNGETYQSQAEIIEQEEEETQAYPELEDLLPEEEEYLDDSGD